MHTSTIRMLMSGFALIDEASAQAYYPIAYNLITGKATTGMIARSEPEPMYVVTTEKNERFYLNEEGNFRSSAPQEEEKYILVIPMQDPIVKYDEECGPRGTESVAKIVEAAMRNNSVAGIVINADSPGGDAYAVERLSRAIKNRTKPVLCHVHGGCNSAMYWIASYCDEIQSNYNLSTIGSVGVYVTVMNMFAYYRENGLPIESVYADGSENKNKAFRQYVDTGKTDELKAVVNQFRNEFVSVVSKNRGIKKGHEVFKGGSYMSAEALSHNLIDGRMTFEETVNRCMALSKNYKPKKSNTKMFGKSKIKSKDMPALTALVNASEEERTQEMVDAANSELQTNGLNAVLISSDAGIATTAIAKDMVKKAADGTAAIANLKTANEKLATSETSLTTANTELTELKALFEGSSEENFSLKDSITKLQAENKTLGDKLDPGAGATTKEDTDEVDDNDSPSFLSSEEEALYNSFD